MVVVGRGRPLLARPHPASEAQRKPSRGDKQMDPILDMPSPLHAFTSVLQSSSSLLSQPLLIACKNVAEKRGTRLQPSSLAGTAGKSTRKGSFDIIFLAKSIDHYEPSKQKKSCN